MEYISILPCILLGIVLGVWSLYMYQQYHKPKVETPAYDGSRPFYVAVNKNGDIYSVRHCEDTYPRHKSEIFQSWVAESAKIEVLSKEELCQRLAAQSL